jgi:hypothetical protein
MQSTPRIKIQQNIDLYLKSVEIEKISQKKKKHISTIRRHFASNILLLIAVYPETHVRKNI